MPKNWQKVNRKVVLDYGSADWSQISEASEKNVVKICQTIASVFPSQFLEAFIILVGETFEEMITKKFYADTLNFFGTKS